MKYVLLASYDNYIEAHIAQGKLESAYINCHLQDDHSVTLSPWLANAIGGIKLLVAESQAARAAEILSEPGPFSQPDS